MRDERTKAFQLISSVLPTAVMAWGANICGWGVVLLGAEPVVHMLFAGMCGWAVLAGYRARSLPLIGVSLTNVVLLLVQQ